MKRPSFQFYPADWRNDPALRMCSLAARGLWWEMLCVMHTCEPYGHLVAAAKAIEPEELGRIVGESAKDVRRWLAELERHAIFSRTEDGTIFSRRMIRDEKEREAWRDRQAKSRANTEDVTEHVTAKSRRSSTSSSPSSSNKSSLRSERAVRVVPQLPDWIPSEEWKAYVEMRKKIHAPLTDRAVTLAIAELEKLKAQGHAPGSVLDQSTAKSWRGLFPVKADQSTAQPGGPDPSLAAAQRLEREAINKTLANAEGSA